MLSQYYRFNKEPFGSTPDTRFLYQSRTHREALASLRYGFDCNRGFTTLISPPGLGKTTLLFRFLDNIRESARTVFVFNTQCKPRELIGYILRDLGIAPERNDVEMHEQLNGVLVSTARAGQRVVLVIDEAQNLSNAALETVRLLTNFETPRAKLLQIVLAGQSELSSKLMGPAHIQLHQRISTSCRLEPLSRDETTGYISHRLTVAGYEGSPLFTTDALNAIVDCSGGIPRTINNLCFNALSLCCALRRKQVDLAIASEVFTDLLLSPQPKATVAVPLQVGVEQPTEGETATPKFCRTVGWVPAFAVVLLLAAVGVLRLPQYSKMNHGSSSQANLVHAPLPALIPAKAADRERAEDIKRTPELIEITVEPQQTLSEIVARHCGSVDDDLLKEITKINPSLINPDHIEPGQKILLPNLWPPSGAEHVTPKS